MRRPGRAAALRARRNRRDRPDAACPQRASRLPSNVFLRPRAEAWIFLLIGSAFSGFRRCALAGMLVGTAPCALALDVPPTWARMARRAVGWPSVGAVAALLATALRTCLTSFSAGLAAPVMAFLAAIFLAGAFLAVVFFGSAFLAAAFLTAGRTDEPPARVDLAPRALTTS